MPRVGSARGMNGKPPVTRKGIIMYTTRNFKTKKEFKQAVEAWNVYAASPGPWTASRTDHISPVTYFQPGPFGGNEPRDGVLYFEGPHYPKPHRWYAQAVAKDGVIVKVK
jgi:hypothetical protein